jgi:preprotein translocase subunit YajC
MKHLALVLASLLLIATPVRADIIVTTSGGRIVGKIIKETDSEIQVKTDKGPIITI